MINQDNIQAWPRVAIIGDSMLKYLNPTKMRRNLKQNISIKPFLGANTEDMKDYIKPVLTSMPDQVILHIGTNDLKKKSPKTLSQNIANLAQQITTDLPNAKITISHIITRVDDPNLTAKVSETNSDISKLCLEKGWSIITHDNILRNHLNNYGLHLTKQGTAILAKNIINFLKDED